MRVGSKVYVDSNAAGSLFVMRWPVLTESPASADRRPVDPPPVVELRIFEGEAMNDITFSYNANFFLFATLENARPIAHGRVAQTAPSFPILTGMPVSGMAYLDRPIPAGYFIFPDLSVRHEGKYRLGFTLYEEVKEPKDADSEPATNHPDHPTNQAKVANPLAPKAHVDWRLEVKSKPFTVFSAKKFPGLAESTALSRIVAEQGCRVRIRRDVRMRRREKAPEYEEYDEDAGYMRSRATPTPDPYRQATPIQAAHPADTGRQRSPSAGSVGGRTPYGMEHHRGSVPDQTQYGPQYQQGYGTGPQGAAGAYPPHLSFGGAPNSHYATPAYGAAQSPAAVQPTSGYAQPQMSYFPQAPNHPYAPQQSAPTHHMRQGSGEISGAPRRGSVSYPQPPSSYPSQPAPAHNYSYSEASYGRPQQQQQQQPAYQPYQNSPAARAPTPTPASNAHSLPPLKMALPVEAKPEAASSPAGPPPNNWASATERSPELDGIAVKEGGFTEYSTGPTSVGAHVNERTRTGKRPFGSVFDAAQHDQSYRNGMRPSEEQTGLEASQPTYEEDEFDSAYELQQMKMQYKRADGTEISRRLPAVA